MKLDKDYEYVNNYPQLYSLSLINFQAKRLLKYLTGIIFNFVPFIEKKIMKLLDIN
jgi:hypothetical protein